MHLMIWRFPVNDATSDEENEWTSSEHHLSMLSVSSPNDHIVISSLAQIDRICVPMSHVSQCANILRNKKWMVEELTKSISE